MSAVPEVRDLHQHVDRALADLPPLTGEQCDRVAALLDGGA